MIKDEEKDTHCDCKNCDCKETWHHHHHHHGGHQGGGAIYGFGFIGALFYFLQHAVTVNDYLWGILKAFAWPAFVIFHLLTLWKI